MIHPYHLSYTSARNPPNATNRPHAIHPNEMRRGEHLRATFSSKMRRIGACVPARTSAQRRFHTGNGFCVSRIVCGELNDGCALVGRHGRAHRHRPYPSPSYFSTRSYTNKRTIYMQFTPNEINRPCAIRPYPTPPNHAVCPYPIGVILSIAQGWQVQRSLPWVMMQARRLPPWGLYFFSSHIITIRGE